ncbi:hypothetical protein AK812_SmicGene12595 [Symbiodinium microadriaticum]|uniref:GYF domain-containing protein n=1 Tax=Symbiodinium microadriaticum TaxID=2951 RepID=A0A1Q9EA55_SYMMI|nr:hypothetical protein AK812_SmicGene12595 [Symbiodinium microadriaticum]
MRPSVLPWYFMDAYGQEQGPVPSSKLRKNLECGGISQALQVRLPNWDRYFKVEELWSSREAWVETRWMCEIAILQAELVEPVLVTALCVLVGWEAGHAVLTRAALESNWRVEERHKDGVRSSD